MFYFLIAIILGALLYSKIVKSSKFWDKRGIPNEPSWSIIGIMRSLILGKRHLIKTMVDLYNKYPQERYVGYMQSTRPFLLLRDLDLIREVGIKDFDHFHDHFAFDQDALFSKSLVTLTGREWQQMRATLSPAFTSSKMRNLYHMMTECAENFCGHFKGKEAVAVEVKDIFSRFATDVIATTAFGVKTDSLKQPNNDFFKNGTRLTRFGFLASIKIFIFYITKTISKMLGIQIISVDVSKFFRSIIKENIAKREKDKIVRPDLIQLLMEAREGQLEHEATIEEKDESFATVEESHIGKNGTRIQLTEEHIIAQAMLFFFAGVDTTSTTSAFMAYELALNLDIQRKLQEEVDTIKQKHNGKISYEDLLSMKYLDQVICETLRLWPPAFQTDRLCTKDYQIMPKNPRDKLILVEKGMSVVIPIIAIQRDPRYYHEPNRFNPERFSDENKVKIVPGSYIPFGLGPRNCIGSRFALLQIKTLFFHLLSKFDIVPIEDTQIPLEISPKQADLAPEKGFRLGFKPRKKMYVY